MNVCQTLTIARLSTCETKTGETKTHTDQCLQGQHHCLPTQYILLTSSQGLSSILYTVCCLKHRCLPPVASIGRCLLSTTHSLLSAAVTEREQVSIATTSPLPLCRGSSELLNENKQDFHWNLCHYKRSYQCPALSTRMRWNKSMLLPITIHPITNESAS